MPYITMQIILGITKTLGSPTHTALGREKPTKSKYVSLNPLNKTLRPILLSSLLHIQGCGALSLEASIWTLSLRTPYWRRVPSLQTRGPAVLHLSLIDL